VLSYKNTNEKVRPFRPKSVPHFYIKNFMILQLDTNRGNPTVHLPRNINADTMTILLTLIEQGGVIDFNNTQWRRFDVLGGAFALGLHQQLIDPLIVARSLDVCIPVF
jgi:hypothetical protein